MKHLTATLALVALAAGGLAAAQTTPQSQSPRSSYPSSAPPPSSTSGSESSSTSAKSSKKQQIKDCMAHQEANNSGMSKSAMKKYCEDQVKSSSHESSSSPHE